MEDIVKETIGRDRATMNELGVSVELEKRADGDYNFVIKAPTGGSMVLAAMLTTAAQLNHALIQTGRSNPVLSESFMKMMNEDGEDPIPEHVMLEVSASLARGVATALALRGMEANRRDEL